MKFYYAVMAAGESRRFRPELGQQSDSKLLAQIQGELIIDRAINVLLSAGAPEVYVIAGAYWRELESHLSSRSNAIVMHHTNWQAGLGSSLAFCSQRLPKDGHLMIALADQVRLARVDLEQITSAATAAPEKIICSKFTKTLGPPVVFPPQSRHDLSHVNGDKGAKALLHLYEQNNNLVSIPIARAGFDIDTREDLEHANAEYKRGRSNG